MINFISDKIKINAIAFFYLIMVITGCNTSTSESDSNSFHIELNPDSTKIILNGLENNIVQSLKTDTLSTQNWQKLFAIYSDTSDTGEFQSQPLSGTYTIDADNNIIFSPDSAFISNRTYSAIFYYPEYYSTVNILRHKNLPATIRTIEKHFQF